MQNGLKFIFFAVITLMIASCSSTQNLREGRSIFGGGFSDEELRPGLYSITALGNTTPWASYAWAKETWNHRANQLCGKDQHQEIIASQDVGYKGTSTTYAAPGVFVPLPIFNARLHGFILCNSSGLSKDEAIQFIESIRQRDAETLNANLVSKLMALGGSDCSTANLDISADNLSKRGQLLINLSRYEEGIICLMKAIGRGEGTVAYRESCEELGRIYEMGWGIPANLSIAKEWYKKAGLL